MENSREFGENSLQQKMRVAEEKVLSLQEVIKKLQTTKKFLHLNAVEVKASIHSNISRLLESMRSREVWLLNQVDMILEAKEVGLRHQEDQLNRAIGQLSNCLNLMNGGATLNSELNDLLCKIDSVGKHPVESPHISFRADIGTLRQAVLEFGRVDSRRLPLEAFASPHLRSSSLPQPFEDYEDDEHHIFHKSVHEIHEKKHGKSIIFNFPKLSSDIPSWVSPIHSSSEAINSWNKAADAKSKSVGTTADYKRPTTACSISQWMQEIKMEDEDDELMNSQFSPRFGNKGIATPASAPCLLSGSSLLRRASSLGNGGRDTGNPNVRSETFPFLSARLQDWLIDGECRLPKCKTPEDKECSAPFEPCVFKPSMDSPLKENVLEGCMKKIAAQPTNYWLSPSAESIKLESENSSSILAEYAKKIAILPWLISSRGLTKESSKDFGKEREKGILEAYAQKIASLKWLVTGKKESENENHEEEFELQQDIMMLKDSEGILEAYAQNLDLKSWLMKAEEEEGEKMTGNTKTFFEYMNKILQMPKDTWLLMDHENTPPHLSEYGSDDITGNSAMDCSEQDVEELSLEDKKTSVNLNSYFEFLNSLPFDRWLLSTPSGKVSELEELK